MTAIQFFDPIDFLEYIISKIEVHSENPTNYAHTHTRVWLDVASGRISFNELCINEYGSAYARNVFGSAIIPKEWYQFLPKELLNEPNWIDLEA
jgi:hypothetical protein